MVERHSLPSGDAGNGAGAGAAAPGAGKPAGVTGARGSARVLARRSARLAESAGFTDADATAGAASPSSSSDFPSEERRSGINKTTNSTYRRLPTTGRKNGIQRCPDDRRNFASKAM